jgi:hypothetical protein
MGDLANLPGSCSGPTRVDELVVKDSLFTFQDTENLQRPLFRFFLLSLYCGVESMRASTRLLSL